MAHFRGTVSGARGEVSRLGHKASGMRVEAQSWQGKVVTVLSYNEATGKNMAYVTLEAHHGNGHRGMVLYNGPVGGAE